MNLSDRIDAAYKAHTGSSKARGARAWFARTLKVSTRTVTRWCNGTQAFDGPALAMLEMLENLARLIRGHEAKAAEWGTATIGAQWEHDACLMHADNLRLRGP